MANYVYATDPRKPIPIGVQGENDARTVVFDIHKWIEDYGNGSALLVHQRPGDAEPYPVTTAQKAGTIEWSVQQADIIAGAPGRAQLSYQVGENIVARSPIYLTIAADEITNTTLADYDPAESWLNAILGAVQEAGDITDDVQAAQTAATQAGQSAAAAAESASDAAASAQTAAQHAGEVTSGVQAAAQSATAAAQSATQAAGSATAAENSATAASGSATAASNSASAAAESEGDAAESASAAAQSAAAAQEAAQSAQDYSGKPPIIQTDTWWTWDAMADAYKDTGHPAAGEPAGFGQITATIDNAVGTPEVTVSATGSNTAKNLAFAFKNLKGEPGTAAGFGSATASVDGSTGTPDVTVSVSGPDTAKVFDFQFSGLKGQTGEAAGFGEITATVGATVGVPSVSVEASGPDTAKNLAFTFTNLKGEPGESVGSIQRTSGTGAPGTSDTYTMYNDAGGEIGTFSVYNGADGAGSGDFKADGSVPMTGDLNAGGHRVTNVGAPTAEGDAVRQSDLQAVSDEIDAIIAGTTPVAVPVATDAKAGVVMPGDHLSVETDGTLNATWPDLSGYATQTWVEGRGYLTAVPAGYATEDWVTGRGYITGAALTGYATQAWVEGKNYLTAVPDEYVTSTELTQALGDYVTADTLAGYGYITSSALNGYATQSWVQGQGYLTAVPAEYVTDSELTGKGYAVATDVAETYAKKSLKFTATFKSSGWTSATGGYSQTINVSGLTADDEPIVDLNSTATDADTFNGQLEAFGLVSNFTTGDETLTAVVLGDSAPTVDIPIHGVVVY